MGKIKINLVSGTALEKPLISCFKGTNANYIVLDNESNGSMGLPIIIISKLNGTNLEKIIDPNEWGAVKENLRTIISGTALPYLAVPDTLSAPDDFFTQLTLPVASYDLLKSVYAPPAPEPAPAAPAPEVAAPAPAPAPEVPAAPVVEAPTEITLAPIPETPAPAAPAVQTPAPQPAAMPTAPVETPVSAPVNTPAPVTPTPATPVNMPVDTPAPVTAPTMAPETPMPEVITPPQVTPEAAPVTPIPAPQEVSAPTPVPEPAVEPAQTTIEAPAAAPVNTPAPAVNAPTPAPSAPAIDLPESQPASTVPTDADIEKIKETFMKSCENMFDALIKKFQNKN